jgi:hypothetical protein
MDLKPKHDTKERMVKDVPPPAVGPLENFWPEDGDIDLDKLRTHLVNEGRLSKVDAARLISTATQVFKKEPNLLDVPQPVTGTLATSRGEREREQSPCREGERRTLSPTLVVMSSSLAACSVR